LESIAPGLREKIEAERDAALTPEQRELLQSSTTELNDEQVDSYFQTKRFLEVTWRDLADRIAQDLPEQASRARKLSSRLAKLRERITITDTNRDVSNYPYWKSRCEFEQTAEALKARERAYAGKRAFQDKADLLEARRLYEESFDLWSKVLADYPELIDDTTAGADIMEYIDQYNSVLQQLSKSLADEDVDQQFPLWELLEINDGDRRYVEEIATHRRRLAAEEQESNAER
ncbi:MAG: hypothetical protein MI725_02905, partial [Pirellulales bacterium]|nr:hypothetical protein [Pirellulales bacterium]